MMAVIIGGSCQGKREYVKQAFGLSEAEMADGNAIDIENLSEKIRCVYHLERLVWNMMQKEKQYAQIETELCEKLNEKVIICDDISCGIVPLDPKERAWREMTGRLLCVLVKRAERVVRVQCGLPQVLKG